jgi:hypothetical protein
VEYRTSAGVGAGVSGEFRPMRPVEWALKTEGEAYVSTLGESMLCDRCGPCYERWTDGTSSNASRAQNESNH